MRIKSDIFQLITRLGYGQEFLDIYRTLRPPKIDQNRFPISRDVFDYDPSDEPVVFPMSQQSIHHAFRYLILAYGFTQHGYRPVFIIEDGLVPICIFDNPDAIGAESKASRIVDSRSDEKMFNQFVDTILLSDYNIGDNYTQNSGINIATEGFAEASTRKLLKIYSIDSDDTEKIKHLFKKSGQILSNVYKRIYQDLEPTCVISNDDKYNIGGIPLEVATQLDIPAYSTAAGWLGESLVLGNVSHRNSLPQFERVKFVENQLSRSLENSQKRILTG